MSVVQVQGKCYEIIENYRDAFDEQPFVERYSDILSKYDFIVGDWGYGQLRLKGFFDDQNSKATFDTKISTLPEYLYEYCNFGCAYFVVKQVECPPEQLEQLEELEQPEQQDKQEQE